LSNSSHFVLCADGRHLAREAIAGGVEMRRVEVDRLFRIHGVQVDVVKPKFGGAVVGLWTAGAPPARVAATTAIATTANALKRRAKGIVFIVNPRVLYRLLTA
jgi:hypothetical protein